MDVALDRADHHRAHLGRAGLGQQGPEDHHARLHRVGGQQHLGHEQDAVAKVDANDPHALDQGHGENLVGRPVAPQQDVDGLLDLFGESVVEVLVHLLHELLVVQFRQNDFVYNFVFVSHRTNTRCIRRIQTKLRARSMRPVKFSRPALLT